MKIIAYTYEADFHCVTCTQDRWARRQFTLGALHPDEVPEEDEHGVPIEATDQERNRIHPVFDTDELPCHLPHLSGDFRSPIRCRDCHEVIAQAPPQPSPARTPIRYGTAHWMPLVWPSETEPLREEALRNVAEQIRQNIGESMVSTAHTPANWVATHVQAEPLSPLGAAASEVLANSIAEGMLPSRTRPAFTDLSSNLGRAFRAENALEAYATFGNTDPMPNLEEMRLETFGDLLCDMMHLADRYDIGFYAMLDRARRNYLEEIRDDVGCCPAMPNLPETPA